MAAEDAMVAFRRGENVEAQRLAELDLAAARVANDPQASVGALCMLARVALRAGRLELVEARAAEAQQIAQDVGDTRLGRMPLHMRAVAARMDRRYDQARQLYQHSIELNEALGEHLMAALEHRNLAYAEIHAGNIDRARQLFAEARRRFAGLDHGSLVPYLTFDEATLAALDLDFVTAAARLRESDRQFRAQAVVPDPDDAAEIKELRHRLANG